MTIRKTFKVLISAILSLAILASVTVMPLVSADTSGIISYENVVVNGSFENGLDGWNQNWADFTSVNAADEGLTAPDGDKVLKIAKQTQWAWREQFVNVIPNTDYEYSFWVYRPDSSSTSVYKLGITGSETIYNPNGTQTYLNTETVGKWVQKKVVFNTGSNTQLKLVFCAHTGTAYIDNIKLVPITNFVTNGSFEDDFTGWSGNLAGLSVVDAATEGLTAVDGENITKVSINDGSRWANRAQTLTVEANTDYVFSMWAYQVDADSKLILKIGNSTGDAAYCPNSSEYQIWGKHKTYGEWFKITMSFNSGDDTTFKIFLVLSGGVTYADDIKLQKKANITATASEGGTVAGLPATVGKGDTITLTATANHGYTVDGWYKGEEKITDSAIYTFTANEDSDYTAKFVVDPAIISDGGFEDETLNGGWLPSSGGALSAVTDEVYEGNGAALIKPAAAWANTRYEVTLEAQTDYTLRFMAKSAVSAKAVVKFNNPSGTNILDGAPSNGNYEIAAGSDWTQMTYYFNTGDATAFKLFLTGGSTAIATYIDNIEIVKTYAVTATADENGTATAPANRFVIGDSATVTATANTGYWFDGWYNGDTKVSDKKAYTFTVEGDTALVAKFVPANYNGLVENGDFETDYTNGWSTNFATDFSVVDASAEAPAVAIDGGKILKVSATGTWHALNQNLTLEANKEYVISFWYYRAGDGYISLKFGNSTADNAMVKESWLNNEAKNTWVYKKWSVTTTDDTTLKLFLCAFDGTAYIDDVCVTAADDIGNLIQNGDMSNVGMAVNAGVATNTESFVYDADAEGYTGNGALKVTGDGVDNWHNLTYTVNVKANTDYVFRFYAKNVTAGNKTIYKVLNASDVSFIGGDKWTNGDGLTGDGSDWGRNEWRFNSGENTSIKLQFVERADAVSYIDDIYFGEAIDATVSSTNEEFGGYYANKSYVGEDDEVIYTATTTAGGNFLGWRVGDSEELVTGETYTYKGFDDITVTAVFEAKVGNLNEDSAINITDLAALRNVIMESEDFTALGDMDGNGAINAIDVVSLKKYIANLGE